MDQIRPKFIEKDQLEIVQTSSLKKLKYTLLIKWVTEEHELNKANEARAKRVEALEKAIAELEAQRDSVTEEKHKLEKAIARPYELKTVTIADEHADVAFDAFQD